MIPWVLLDRADMPGGGELRLWRRGDEFSIRVGREELMNSRLFGSEEALARLPCERLADRRAAAILIGGLGMGFTLRAALSTLGADAQVTVAELSPAVISWAKGPLRPLTGDSLEDSRVTIHQGDVGVPIRAGRARFDAILLDVDNGPEGFAAPANDSLYGPAGLAQARAALRPRGILAIWSAVPDLAFAARLGRSGFAVEEVRVRADRGRRGARHVIWLATR